MVWMDDLVRQMSTSEKPRDVSGVELLMNSHQNHKAEIDARESNFSECISLGKELLTRNHYASNEIKEKLVELTEQRNGMFAINGKNDGSICSSFWKFTNLLGTPL
jgi:spectrin beta